jgi:Cu2+-exporting ATPase
MEINPQQAIKLEKDGETFYFCSQHCKNKFLAKSKMKMNHKIHTGHMHHEKIPHIVHHAHMVEDFKRRFWISLIATIPVLILSPLIQSFFRFSLKFPGYKLVLFGISTFIYFYGGLPFLKGILEELKKKQPGMMTLIALAITVAYVYSSSVVFGVRGMVFFWELVTLIDIMLLGHWIEMRQVLGASRALEQLAKLMPSEAHLVLGDGSIKDIKLEELRRGDKVLVKPGEKVPADGRIIDGESEVNEAMITGESNPVSKKADSEVIGGSVNGSGSLVVEVNKIGKDTYLSRVAELVRIASESKSRAQDFANRAAFWLTLIAIIAGTLTLISWLILGKEFVFALERMVTVMVITCPHALGLAIPLVVAVISALSARNGLLIRNRTAFENARNLQTIVFDKTGTLTKGEFGVSDIISLGDWTEDDLLRKVASIEVNSEHTIAKGIVKKAKEKNLKLPKAEKFEAIAGKGAKAEVEGEEIYIGNKNILEVTKIESDEAEKEMERIASQGKTIVFAVSGGKVQGIVGLSDIIREESREAVESLKNLGLEIAMITGDNKATAKYVANQLGLDTYFAEVLPDKKSEKIKELQRQDRKVAMVGDGVNDAPALAQADVGIAIGAGTDVAGETADVILVKNDPRNVLDVIALSRATQRKMVQNLVWATGYNIFAIPLASGILYKYGIILPPAVGALVMSLSTIIVAINARLISYPSTWVEGKSGAQ